jgi:DNA-binding MarR family transcriptional regulator
MAARELTDEEVEMLKRKSERIAALRAEFKEKIKDLRQRQRNIIETAFTRLDSEKAEQIRKSINEMN